MSFRRVGLVSALLVLPVLAHADSPYTDEANLRVRHCIEKAPHVGRKVTARLEVGRWATSRENHEDKPLKVWPVAVVLIQDSLIACRWQAAVGEEPFARKGRYPGFSLDPVATIEISEDGKVARKYLIDAGGYVYAESSDTYRDLDAPLTELLQRLSFDFLPVWEDSESSKRRSPYP